MWSNSFNQFFQELEFNVFQLYATPTHHIKPFSNRTHGQMDEHGITGKMATKPIKRLFLVVGHALLVPEVSSARAAAFASDKYAALAEPPFKLPAHPGAIITTAAYGKSTILTQVVDGCPPRVVNAPYEMLKYVQKIPSRERTLGNIMQMMKDMRSKSKDHKIFAEDTEFALRFPREPMPATVVWAEGERIIFGGVWMIDLEDPTSLVDVSAEFGLVQRRIGELEHQPMVHPHPECMTTLVDAAFTHLEDVCATLSVHSPEFKKINRECNDLRLSGQNCLGELKFQDSERPVTLREFLHRGQRFLTDDDAMALIMCRNLANYAGDAAPSSGSHTPRGRKFGGVKKTRKRRAIMSRSMANSKRAKRRRRY
jgi:hypothetical protein